jgi:hypothetical protein
MISPRALPRPIRKLLSRDKTMRQQGAEVQIQSSAKSYCARVVRVIARPLALLLGPIICAILVVQSLGAILVLMEHAVQGGINIWLYLGLCAIGILAFVAASAWLARWQISALHRWRISGRKTAFWRGDMGIKTVSDAYASRYPPRAGLYLSGEIGAHLTALIALLKSPHIEAHYRAGQLKQTRIYWPMGLGGAAECYPHAGRLPPLSMPMRLAGALIAGLCSAAPFAYEITHNQDSLTAIYQTELWVVLGYISSAGLLASIAHLITAKAWYHSIVMALVPAARPGLVIAGLDGVVQLNAASYHALSYSCLRKPEADRMGHILRPRWGRILRLRINGKARLRMGQTLSLRATLDSQSQIYL